MTHDLYNVTVVGSSFVRRLRDDIYHRKDSDLITNFGLEEVMTSYVCGGGWTVPILNNNMDDIIDSWPDIW